MEQGSRGQARTAAAHNRTARSSRRRRSRSPGGQATGVVAHQQAKRPGGIRSSPRTLQRVIHLTTGRSRSTTPGERRSHCSTWACLAGRWPLSCHLSHPCRETTPLRLAVRRLRYATSRRRETSVSFVKLLLSFAPWVAFRSSRGARGSASRSALVVRWAERGDGIAETAPRHRHVGRAGISSRRPPSPSSASTTCGPSATSVYWPTARWRWGSRGTLAVGRPFTLEYAREHTDPPGGTTHCSSGSMCC